MLEQLTIRNFALIENLTVDFNQGLNILTGETGAGKSIIIGALGLILGEKGETSSIRTGTEEALVSAIVKIPKGSEAERWLEDHEINPEDNSVIVRRSLKSAGRGSVFIQNIPVGRQELAELFDTLIDMHGQHEHQSLLQVQKHRIFLDQFAGLTDQVKLLTKEFQSLTDKKKELEQALIFEKNRLQEIDFLTFAVREIEAAKLTSGEEEVLETQKKLLSQHEKLFGLLNEISEILSDNHLGSLSGLRKVKTALQSASYIDQSLTDLAKRTEEAYFEIEDIGTTIKEYMSSAEFSPGKLEEIEERLALIHKLKKKYGANIQEILSYGEESAEKLLKAENWDSEKKKLEADVAELEKTVINHALDLSKKRKAAALKLQTDIEAILKTLGMPKAQFLIQLRQRASESGRPVCSSTGIDEIEFMLSSNLGEPVKPLGSVASGGEISRVMLAIKTVLASTDNIQTLIFDEIDTGIGGEVALAVGEHLSTLGKTKQVLCITHLATIAVRADNHMKVAKEVQGTRTSVSVSNLVSDLKIGEIARMLSGDASTGASINHAEELLRKYKKI